MNGWFDLVFLMVKRIRWFDWNDDWNNKFNCENSWINGDMLILFNVLEIVNVEILKFDF